MNILLKMAFDGSAYHGFQVQDNRVTVCRTFQQALEKVLGHPAQIKGCSRTDRGVHALVYYINFHTQKPLDLKRLPLALNANLPTDIRVYGARAVPEDFHARYSCLGKKYVYNILNSYIDSPFASKYAWRISPALDDAAMDKAAKAFVGKRDFSSFRARRRDTDDPVRTVYSAAVTRRGDRIKFEITADGYLYNMVRIMTGTLVNVGLGKTESGRIEKIIRAGDRKAAGPTAPPKGLFLADVFYDFTR